MPQVVTQSIKVTDAVTETLTFGTVSGLQAEAKQTVIVNFGTGVTAGNIDQHFEKAYTLAAAATTTLTLSALVDDLGRTVAFAKIKRLSINITAKTGNDWLVIGGAAANPVTSLTGGGTQTFTVRGYDLKTASDTNGFAVGVGASDQLKFLNAGAASMTFTVSISGTSS
jgi:hypothetical protein